MTKVIAILDEPKSCMYCEFGSHTICGAKHNNMTSNAKFPEIAQYDIYKNKIDETKPDWCPLASMPKRKDDVDRSSDYNRGFDEGWNDCIDYIMIQTL